MSLRIRQIVVAASDLEKTVEQFTKVLNIQVCYRDPAVTKFGLENAMMVIGDQLLEVVSPTDPKASAARHIERYGDSGYMLILQTDDLMRERIRFEELGVRIVYETERPGVKALHLHPKDIGGAIVSIDEANPSESWPWAGPAWGKYSSSVVGALRVKSTTMGAIHPDLLAKRWSDVLGTDVPIQEGNVSRIKIDDGELLFKASSSDRIEQFSVEVADLDTSIATAKYMNLPVIKNKTTNRVTICGVNFNLIASR